MDIFPIIDTMYPQKVVKPYKYIMDILLQDEALAPEELPQEGEELTPEEAAPAEEAEAEVEEEVEE